MGERGWGARTGGEGGGSRAKGRDEGYMGLGG